MSFTLRWKIDKRALAAAAMRQAAHDAVGDAAEYILETANRTVPIEEATLKRSGQVSQDGLTAMISYDTPYAARQHEELDYRHDSGRRAKWLEKTMEEEEKAVTEFLRKKLGGVLK